MVLFRFVDVFNGFLYWLLFLAKFLFVVTAEGAVYCTCMISVSYCGNARLKRALITLLALLSAASVWAADLTASWEVDFGWAGNFSDEYTMAAEELELTLASDFGSHNHFRTELELENLGATPRYVGWNSFILTTDLAGYFGLRDVALIWENGYAVLGGADEYSDFGVLGYANAAADKAELENDLATSLGASTGTLWASLASSWNLGADSTDPAAVAVDSERRVQLFVGAVDAVPGLSLEAGLRADLDRGGTTALFDGAWTLPLDGWTATVGGSYAATDLSADDLLAMYGPDAEVFGQIFGAGVALRRETAGMTELYASASFKGDDTESFRVFGGGAGFVRRPLGAEAAFSYDRTSAGGEGTFDGLDISAHADIDGAVFTIGYVFTDGYGWSNNSTAPLPTVGGAYMKVTADF